MYSSCYFRVLDDSMSPSISEGDFVILNQFVYYYRKPRIGDVVICRNLKEERDIVKRIIKVDDENNRYWIEGDNKEKSIDSREFGWIKRSKILGKVWIVRRKSS